MTQFFNDTPIETPDDDRYGFDPFARALATSFLQMKAPVGAAIALNGAWGSGKSSAVNLIRYHLRAAEGHDDLTVIDFRCWWFRGEEALTLAFLQELNRALKTTLGDKAKDLVPKLGKGLLQAGPVIGTAITLAGGGPLGGLVGGSLNFAKRFFPDGDSVEKVFEELSSILQKQKRRFLVIVDDIDRLTPDEALLVFRLTKSVGRLPNVMYLLVFDRELAEKAVAEKYPSEGPHFLEKIIQASFELPLPLKDDLNNSILSEIERVCGSPPEPQMVYFMNIFYDAVAPYITAPRHVVRLANSIGVSWPAVAEEVNRADFLALEVMRLFESKLYAAIRSRKDEVCGVRSMGDPADEAKKLLESLVALATPEHAEKADTVVQRLFPRFENMGYSADFIATWEAERRVCTRKHFDTYFRMTLGDESVPRAEIEEVVARSGETDFIKDKFRGALKTIRKNGKSRVPLLFEELNVHAAEISDQQVPSLVATIFEIADEIDREADRERVMGFATNHLRIHWLIRRLTFERWSLEDRSKVFVAACERASIGWLVDFTSSAIDDYHPRNKEKVPPPERCLVEEKALAGLTTLALSTIRLASGNGTLLKHPRLVGILFRWREFADDGGAEVRAWTSSLLRDDLSLAILAKSFTGESWSQGMGFAGLGDRVARRLVNAQVEGIETILDAELFRLRLREVLTSPTMDDEDKKSIQTFLDAWDRKDKRRD